LAKAQLKAELVPYRAPISEQARKKGAAETMAIAGASAQEVGKAKALIESALRAAGGIEKIKGIKDVQVSSKMKVTMGGRSQDIAIKHYTLLPDKHRIDSTVDGDVLRMVITKEFAFQQMGTHSIDLSEPAAEKARREQAQRGVLPTSILVRAAQGEIKVRATAPTEKDGRKLDVIEMIDRDGEATTLWLDAQTHLLARVGDADGGAEFEDWRSVSGVMYPFKVRIRGRQTVDLVTDEVRINSGLSPELFKRK
jgi:hypothetical protein